MCANIGHGDERVIAVITEEIQERTIAGPPLATKPRAKLDNMLSDIALRDLNRFLFTLGSAYANENAIKLVCAYTGKYKILTRYRSFHGTSVSAMALTGDPRCLAWEPNLMPGVVHFLDHYRNRSTFHRPTLIFRMKTSLKIISTIWRRLSSMREQIRLQRS